MTSSYRGLLWLIILIIVVLGGLELISYLDNFRKVSLEPGANISVSVYKDLGGPGYNYSASKPPLYKLNSTEIVKLKENTSYDFVVSDPSHQYANPITKILITKATKDIVINPYFSTQKLASMLASDQAAIQAAILSRYPYLPTFYTVTSGQLFDYGNWYGAVLSPVQPQYDTLRIIMEEKNGLWSLVTAPQISIGIPSNPTIPSDVIDNTDRL